MGIFHEQIEVINRTSKRLDVRYDGQDMELEPNYNDKGERIPDVHNTLPEVAIPYAKAQNVLMGSEDPIDPSSFEVLVGVKAKKGQKQVDDISFCEQSLEDLTRVKLADYLDDPNAKIVLSGRKLRNSEARIEGDKMPFDPRPKS